jgi:hypothetical protein
MTGNNVLSPFCETFKAEDVVGCEHFSFPHHVS